MAFKMKGSPFHQMESDAQQRKNLMNDNPVDSKASALNKMDPMHNGEPGVQKEDFEQFSSPMNQGYSDRYNKKGESQIDVLNKRVANANNYNKKLEGVKFTSEGTLASAKKKQASYTLKINKSQDSINSVNKVIDKKIAKLKNTPKDSPMNQGKKSKTKKFPKGDVRNRPGTKGPKDTRRSVEAMGEAKPIKAKEKEPQTMKERIAKGKAKADAKKKSPLNNKENRAEVKAAKEGKSGKEKRQAARAVRKQQRKEGKRGIKKTIKQVEKTVAKVKDSKVYKVGKGVADTVANVKSGRIGAAIESGKKTIADAKKKKSDSPATMKKSKY
jgi:hypothetical protein